VESLISDAASLFPCWVDFFMENIKKSLHFELEYWIIIIAGVDM
jgi:hypothetical protein